VRIAEIAAEGESESSLARTDRSTDSNSKAAFLPVPPGVVRRVVAEFACFQSFQ
jgi:hypothetical protein